MWLWQGFQVFVSSFFGMLRALLSLFPVFDQINSIPDQLLAAALGIPVAVVSGVLLLISIGRFVWRNFKDA